MTLTPSRSSDFNDWTCEWMAHAAFTGPKLLDEDERMTELLALWRKPIPGGDVWKRGPDQRLRGSKKHCHYLRGDLENPRNGEHALERDLLVPTPDGATYLGHPLIDGVNAVPLSKDAGGKRQGNVEADMLLLAAAAGEHLQLLVEVKVASNNAWFAAVESLRQSRLFRESPATQTLFKARLPKLNLPQELRTIAVVLAPQTFYSAPGKRAQSVAPAQKLLRRFHEEFGEEAHLAVWNAESRTIDRLSSTP